MRIVYNPRNADAVKVVAAASLATGVELSECIDGGLRENPSTLITSTTLVSQNAIVCRILDADPMEPVLLDFLLWESTILNPSIKKCIIGKCTPSGNPEHPSELDRLLIELEKHMAQSISLFNTAPPSAASVIIWADLLPLFHSGSSSRINRYPRLAQFFEQIDNVLPSRHILIKFLGEATDPTVLWLSASGSKVPTELIASNKKSESKAKDPKRVEQPKNMGSGVKQPAKGKLPNSKNQTPVPKADPLPSAESLEQTPAVQVGAEDLKKASAAFKPLDNFKRPVYPTPKCPLPKSEGIRNILITSALPYVNNVPHLGNMIGSTLSASVFALFCELAGHNVLSICGTDEYGTATEAKALAEHTTPQEICNRYNKLHRDVYDWFDIQFDYFGRTTTEKHTEIVQELFSKLWKNKFITEDVVEQLFCEKCSKFLADRFVEGICPFCKYDDARGDQCDKCGRLINAVDLKQPRCKTCQHSPVLRSSKHLFLDLPKIEPQLDAFLANTANAPDSLWTSNARTISSSWIRDGLKARCITRDLKWGVPVPVDAYKNKVFYVWFDAPIGYMSITANYTSEWRQWWQSSVNGNDKPVELIQFMAKDNVPFHAIIFPACLLSANSGYTVVKHLLSTEYMNYEGTKFSKSRGIGIFGDGAIQSGIPSNVWRFYLLYRRPETQDSSFLWDDFVLVNNSELLNNLGNFIHRSLAFVGRFFQSQVPDMTALGSGDLEVLAQVNQLLRTYVELFEGGRLREALRQVLSIARLGNGYIQANQPWVAVKKEETKAHASAVIGVAANMTCLLGLLLYPYMPTVGRQIWLDQCNMPMEALSLLPIIRGGYCLPQFMATGHQIGKPTPLFRKIEAEELDRLSKMFSGGAIPNGFPEKATSGGDAAKKVAA